LRSKPSDVDVKWNIKKRKSEKRNEENDNKKYRREEEDLRDMNERTFVIPVLTEESGLLRFQQFAIVNW
jgi:hypothetical protein